MTRLALLSLLAALLLLPTTALAQDDRPMQPRTAPRTDSPMVTKGSCFNTAAASMPDGSGHDHQNLSQHQFSCGFEQTAFLPLTQELAARPNVMLGESDVKNDIAAVAVAYPEAGALFFDVKDPAHPKFLSWYRGGDCDTLVLDTDCGAYLSLADDGKTAFLSMQAASPLGNGGFNGSPPSTQPGVQVIDIENPSMPVLTDFLPVPGVNGVHTANYHKITNGPAAGEYLFITQNGTGVQIARITRQGGVGHLTPVGIMKIDEVHDTFIQEDPIDKTTYMYVAAGNTSGFYVFDVGNPLAPTLKAEWDLQPQCHKAWYSHTIDVTVVNGHRYVTLPTETFYFGAQDGAEAASGCGEVYGNGDKPGLMWIVDATDLSKLGPANATDGNKPPDPKLAENSKKALVAVWHNAANAPGGDLQFSPHNQTIFGDRIVISAYHGGVTVLNAKAAFEGRNERPYEEAVVIPHSGGRPIYKTERQPANGYFISKFFASPGDIWDVNYYKGYALAYDEHGGMYSFRFDPTIGPSGGGGGRTITPGGCRDVTPPAVRLRKLKLNRRGIALSGTARDLACGKKGTVTRVLVYVARKVGKKCAYLTGKRFGTPGDCTPRGGLVAKGTSKFTFRQKVKLAKGRYIVTVQAADAAGNFSRGPSKALAVR